LGLIILYNYDIIALSVVCQA